MSNNDNDLKIKDMATKKLTSAQFESVVTALIAQFKGGTILIGRKYDYNQNQVLVSQNPKLDKSEGVMRFADRLQIIKDARKGKALDNLLIWDNLDFGYDSFYKAQSLNVQKLVNNYSNGSDAVQAALTAM